MKKVYLFVLSSLAVLSVADVYAQQASTPYTGARQENAQSARQGQPGQSRQGTALMRETLGREDAFSGARIRVAEQPDAAAVVRRTDTVRAQRITLYGVRLLSDNKQTAGRDARAAAERFSGLYPHIPVKQEYESPYFKVTAGNFVDRADAIALCGKLIESFPNAYVAEEDVAVEEVLAERLLLREVAVAEEVAVDDSE